MWRNAAAFYMNVISNISSNFRTKYWKLYFEELEGLENGKFKFNEILWSGRCYAEFIIIQNCI